MPETLRLWRNLLSVYVDQPEMSLVIDLGCGTERFSEILAAHFGVQVIGIDPSLKMLDQARRKPTIGNVFYWQGSAEALPLRDGCADLVFMSMAYHHRRRGRGAYPHSLRSVSLMAGTPLRQRARSCGTPLGSRPRAGPPRSPSSSSAAPRSRIVAGVPCSRTSEPIHLSHEM